MESDSGGVKRCPVCSHGILSDKGICHGCGIAIPRGVSPESSFYKPRKRGNGPAKDRVSPMADYIRTKMDKE
jgi:hypothetical protein